MVMRWNGVVDLCWYYLIGEYILDLQLFHLGESTKWNSVHLLLPFGVKPLWALQ